jgi:hypothetical protein
VMRARRNFSGDGSSVASLSCRATILPIDCRRRLRSPEARSPRKGACGGRGKGALAERVRVRLLGRIHGRPGGDEFATVWPRARKCERAVTEEP